MLYSQYVVLNASVGAGVGLGVGFEVGLGVAMVAVTISTDDKREKIILPLCWDTRVYQSVRKKFWMS